MNAIMLVVVLLIVIALGGAAALWVVYQRLSGMVSRLQAHVTTTAGQSFAQVESLWALERRLGLTHPLPRTRGWAASPDFLRVLMEHALRERPQFVVECSSGISTLVLARCAQINGHGHVHSLENDPAFAERTRELLRAEGLEAFATVHDAPLVPLELPGWRSRWYDSSVLPDGLAIDMLVVDGPPWFVGPLPRFPAVPVFRDKMRSGATVFLDDAARPEEQECVRRWKDEWPALQAIECPSCEKGCAVFVLQPVAR